MACFNPISLKPVLIKETGEYIEGRNVPCGKCVGCLQSKRAEWSFRIMQEFRNSSFSRFVTLTYSDENLPMLKRLVKSMPTLKKRDFQLYAKRLRKLCPHLKYFACGEYGENTSRPHMHAIMMNVDDDSLISSWKIEGSEIGNVKLGDVTEASIHYCTKYMINREMSGKGDKRKVRYHYLRKAKSEWRPIKKRFKDGRLKEFQLMSKGLGKVYSDVCKNYHLSNQSFTTYTEGGNAINLSRYLKDKIFEGKEVERSNIQRKIKVESLSRAEKEMGIEGSYEKRMSRKKAKIAKAINNSKSSVC